MEAIGSSETSVCLRTTHSYNPEDGTPHVTALTTSNTTFCSRIPINCSWTGCDPVTQDFLRTASVGVRDKLASEWRLKATLLVPKQRVMFRTYLPLHALRNQVSRFLHKRYLLSQAYMFMSRHQNPGQNHNTKRSNRSFENVAKFKYL
jgi:hypothetical protein